MKAACVACFLFSHVFGNRYPGHGFAPYSRSVRIHAAAVAESG
jgi:hypothetical protein